MIDSPYRAYGRSAGDVAAEYEQLLDKLASARADVADAERLHRPVNDLIELRRRAHRAWLAVEACRKPRLCSAGVLI